MAQFNGYVNIPHNTYDEWRSEVMGNGYDADGAYGNQCWDLASEFWWNVGFPQGYPVSSTGVSMHGVWLSNVQNAGDKFDLVISLSDVKRGDVIVMGGLGNGHICFADEDFGEHGNYINCLGQNQSSHDYVDVELLGTIDFLGAFRYKGWEQPVPPITSHKKKFPWYLYANKLRENRNML